MKSLFLSSYHIFNKIQKSAIKHRHYGRCFFFQLLLKKKKIINHKIKIKISLIKNYIYKTLIINTK